MKSSFTIVALVATAISLGAVAPSMAQDAQTTPVRQWQNGPRPMHNIGPGAPGGRHRMGPAGLLMLACSDKGAEALEIALVRMSHRLDLNADQQKLFDTFRTNALTTETKFADTCKAERPAKTAGERPDMLARLKAGLAIDQARIEAMQAVLPDFEALYTSLSDTQKAALVPHRDGAGKGRWGRDHGKPAPAAPDAPTPPAPPAKS